MCLLQKKSIWSLLNYFDRGLLVVAVLALFYCGKTFLNQVFDENLTEESILNYGKTNSVGSVVLTANDARYKPSNSFNWSKANSKQKIYTSDSIFVGSQSKVDVELSDSSQLAIGENSLVVFNKLQNQDLANLKVGNFTLNINGNAKLAIQNEIIEIKGHQTRVQIFIDKNKKSKPVIKSISGVSTVVYKKEKIALAENQVLPVAITRTLAAADYILPKDLPETLEVPAVGAPDPAPPRIPLPQHEPVESLTYNWKLYDLYQRSGNELKRREMLPHQVQLNHRIRWLNVPDMRQTTYVMFGDSKDFVQRFQILSSDQPEFTMRNAFIGRNYWRISYDQNNWSPTREIEISGQPREDQPLLTAENDELVIFKKPIRADLFVDASENVKGHVIEVSTTNNFDSDRTHIIWNPTTHIQLPVTKAGDLYVRARRVFTNNEIGDYSNIVRIQTFQNRRPVQKVIPIERLAKTPKAKVRHVLAQVQEKSAAETVKTRPQLKPVRKLASQPQPQILSPMIKPAEIFNDHLDHEQINFTLSSFKILSSDQVSQSQSASTGVSAGIQYLGWFNQHGLRAEFSSKVADGSGTTAGSPTQIELLYMRRLLNGQSLLGKGKIIGLAGYEAYRNSGATQFSPQYDLLKLGAAAYLPFFNNWGVNSEAMAGIGFDQSKRYEFAAQLQYYFSQRLFLGMGYRLFMLEAGSTKSSPTNLPYREVLEEGFSVFGFHF